VCSKPFLLFSSKPKSIFLPDFFQYTILGTTNMTNTLTAARLREVLNYCPDTGVWTWIKRTNSSSRIAHGSVAGYTGTGYRQITIDGKRHRSSRLAYLYMTGEWPAHCVDHIDRCRDNDRWGNLRPVTVAENSANTKANVFIEFNGKRQHAAAWAREIGVSASLITYRRKKGLPLERLLAPAWAYPRAA
jgi:HNH endonuclease